jgi:hypothetical protein
MPADIVTRVTFPRSVNVIDGSSPLAKTFGIVEVGGERP